MNELGPATNYGLTMKTILITGCSSGIGYDAAKTLQNLGWRVLATCRKISDCNRLKNEGLESFVLDYSKDETIDTAVEYLKKNNFSKLDALFNNGAYALPGAVEDLTRCALREIFEVNFFGHVDLMNKLLPLLKKSADGRVINCSSVLGFAALPYRGAYNATKFAIEGFTKALSVELAPKGIRVNSICPTFIKTPMTEPFLNDENFKNQVISMLPIGRLGEIEDLMGPFVFLASDASLLMTGASVLVDGGWTAR